MTRLNLVNVRRCPTCGHLIPEDYQTCPYCSNTEVKLLTALRSQSQLTTPEAPRQRKSMSPQAKKRLRNGFIIGGGSSCRLDYWFLCVEQNIRVESTQ